MDEENEDEIIIGVTIPKEPKKKKKKKEEVVNKKTTSKEKKSKARISGNSTIFRNRIIRKIIIVVLLVIAIIVFLCSSFFNIKEINVENNEVTLTLRFLVHPKKTRIVESDIWNNILILHKKKKIKLINE